MNRTSYSWLDLAMLTAAIVLLIPLVLKIAEIVAAAVADAGGGF